MASLAGQRLRIRLKHFLQSGTFARAMLCFVIFWMTAAAAHSGFIGKWGLRDTSQEFGVIAMLDGTAKRPFVYRQLAPSIANLLDRAVPSGWKKRLAKHADRLPEVFAQVRVDEHSGYRFRYLVIYYLSFFSLLLSLFLLRRILLDWGMDDSIALLAPMSFVLATPYIQTKGGYFYDSIELLFLSAAFLLASRGKIVWLIGLTVPASVNKESFFFFIPALYPLLRLGATRRQARMGIAAAMAVSLAVGLAIKVAFKDSPGSIAEPHLWDNLKALVNLTSYFDFELTYGLIGPRKLFIGTLLAAALIVAVGWRVCNPTIKRHIAIAAMINVPLALALAEPGELRNLSLLDVGFVFLLGYTLSRCLGCRLPPPDVGPARAIEKANLEPAIRP